MIPSTVRLADLDPHLLFEQFSPTSVHEPQPLRTVSVQFVHLDYEPDLGFRNSLPETLCKFGAIMWRLTSSWETAPSPCGTSGPLLDQILKLDCTKQTTTPSTWLPIRCTWRVALYLHSVLGRLFVPWPLTESGPRSHKMSASSRT